MDDMTRIKRASGWGDSGLSVRLRFLDPETPSVIEKCLDDGYLGNKYYIVDNAGNYLTLCDQDASVAGITEDRSVITKYFKGLGAAVSECPDGFSIRCVDKDGKILGEIPKSPNTTHLKYNLITYPRLKESDEGL